VFRGLLHYLGGQTVTLCETHWRMRGRPWTDAGGISLLLLPGLAVPSVSAIGIAVISLDASQQQGPQEREPAPNPATTGDWVTGLRLFFPEPRCSVPGCVRRALGVGQIGRSGTSWTTQFPASWACASPFCYHVLEPWVAAGFG
jgi:hypothetical protein